MSKKRKRIPTMYFPFSTGIFIRDYLLKHGIGSPTDIRREMVKKQQELNYYTGSYLSFMRYFKNLEYLGLIQLVKTETPKYPWLKSKKKYYRITPGKENDIRWSNPFRARYPTLYEKWHHSSSSSKIK